MAIKPACSCLILFSLSTLTLFGQPQDNFPPSKPWVAQLAEKGPARQITLHDALLASLMHNVDIEVEGYGIDLARQSTVNARSYFDPQLGVNVSGLSTNVPVTNILQTGGYGSQITHSSTLSPNIQQNLPGGGTATLTLNMARNSSNGDFVIVNPSFSSSLGLTITQPLWRGFLRTAAERQIVISRLGEQMSEAEFRQKVSYIVEQVIVAYWRLAATVQNYEAQRESREVAVAEYEQARNNLKDHPDDAASLSAVRSEVASHEQSMTQAAVQIVQASNNLKRLLAPTAMDPIWSTGLIPSDRPEAGEPSVTLDQAVETATLRRPELEQLRLQIRQADADYRFARQETKPAVNLRVEMQSNGAAGTVYALSETGQVTTVLNPASPLYGGLAKSLGGTFTVQHPSLAGGLEVKFPAGNRAAASQLATTATHKKKFQAQLRAAEEDIVVEVRSAYETITAQHASVQAANLSRALAEEHLADVKSKFQGDPSNIDILRGQRDLADARVRELQALIDCQLSQVSLGKAMNTLVDDQQIVLAHRK
jgi:outer membrane protein TolC